MSDRLPADHLTRKSSTVGRKGGAQELQIGWKVLIQGRESDGFAEVASYRDEDGRVEVRFHQSAVESRVEKVRVQDLVREVLPLQTRCYVHDGDAWRVGRIVASPEELPGERRYYVQFPNDSYTRPLRETEFRVRSNVGTADPVATLAELAHETPYFFERRSRWVERYERYRDGAAGLTGLASARVELFAHQLEVVRRVLADSTIRYLLADEVGLGKTIEAGAIVRQLMLDVPHLRVRVFTPALLVPQWLDELNIRFALGGVPVLPLEQLAALASSYEPTDLLVIDEAHRLVAQAKAAPQAFALLAALCHPTRTRHLLLLSGTPVLHREDELLALLHLLDPDVYRLDEADAFSRRLARRGPMGSAYAQLVRAPTPALRLRAATRLQEAIPEDETVARAVARLAVAQAAKDAPEMERATDALCVHVSETYRIYRRLLRVRRATLVELGEAVQRRKLGPTEAAARGEAHAAAWQDLEEWRIRAVARTASAPAQVRDRAAAIYWELADAVAAHRETLRERVSRWSVEVPPEERALLAALLDADAAWYECRVEALVRALRARPGSVWVVFCGTAAACASLRDALAVSWPGLDLQVASSSSHDVEAVVRAFRNGSGPRVLLADAVAEEGVNLQCANGLLCWDLPADPMRLEQRIGRLDRRDRVREFECGVVLSHADADLALDAAWYEVLRDGYEVFKFPIADLQLLMDRELGRLRMCAFEGGPAALRAQVTKMRDAIKGERERVERDEAIDGLRLNTPNECPAWSRLDEVEAEEDELAEAMLDYARENLRLTVRMSLERRTITVTSGMQAIVPVQLLKRLQSLAGRPGTFLRTRALKDPSLDFLRPGHPLVDAFRAIASQDERGQAFAMARHISGLADPLPILRFGIEVDLDFHAVACETDALALDAVWRAGLLRLANTWRPARWWEVWLAPDGSPADDNAVEHCRRPYDKAKGDVNLGGERAQVLEALVQPSSWSAVCGRVAHAALDTVRARPEFQAAVAAARRAAAEHFEVLRARGRARAAAGLGDASTANELERIAALIDQLIAAPRLRIDVMGAYVLSGQRVQVS
jgi:ATP-dependent helicase HepA